jgi:lysylphosphatidylglycerol synthetase-like protein (DUF2156 family)
VEASAVRIHHPNREKPQSKATKVAVAVLLVASAALIALVTIGGYEQLAGATIIAVAYVLVYLLMAYFVMRWNRGVLPLAAGMAIIFICFAAVAAPAWFARDKDGFTDPLLPAGLLGLLILVVIAVQLMLIIFSMRGFQQEWSTEVEVREGDEHYEDAEYAYEDDDASDRSDEDTGEHETYEGSAEDRSSDSPRQG